MLKHLTERDSLSEGFLRYPIYSSITIFPFSHCQKGNGGKMIFLHNTLIIYRALFHTTRINFVAFYLMKKNKLCLKYKWRCIMFQGPLQTWQRLAKGLLLKQEVHHHRNAQERQEDATVVARLLLFYKFNNFWDHNLTEYSGRCLLLSSQHK